MELTELAGHRYAVIEDAVDVDNARDSIRALPASSWARYDSPFEAKHTLADKGWLVTSWDLKRLFDWLYDDVHDIAEALFGVDLSPDPDGQYTGVFRYGTGDHLGVHVDAGIHPASGLRKHVTAVLYFGGDGPLELWEGTNAVMFDGAPSRVFTRAHSIAPNAARLVLFENNDYAWHGTPVNTGTEDRIVATVSYLSGEVDHWENKRQRAYFVPRPDEPWTAETYALRDLRSDPVRFAEAYRA